MTASTECPAVTGTPLWLLRLEGVALLVLAVAIYARSGSSWVLFAVLFLAPDISFAGYLLGARTGAAVYNAAHVTILPIALALAGRFSGMEILVNYALIWLARQLLRRCRADGARACASFACRPPCHRAALGRAQPDGDSVARESERTQRGVQACRA